MNIGGKNPRTPRSVAREQPSGVPVPKSPRAISPTSVQPEFASRLHEATHPVSRVSSNRGPPRVPRNPSSRNTRTALSLSRGHRASPIQVSSSQLRGEGSPFPLLIDRRTPQRSLGRPVLSATSMDTPPYCNDNSFSEATPCLRQVAGASRTFRRQLPFKDTASHAVLTPLSSSGNTTATTATNPAAQGVRPSRRRTRKQRGISQGTSKEEGFGSAQFVRFGSVHSVGFSCSWEFLLKSSNCAAPS